MSISINTRLDQKLLQKALNFKYNETQELITDQAVEDLSKLDISKIKVKNICAYVPLDFADRLETILGILKISKREFVTLALEEAMSKADSVMDDLGVTAHLEELAEYQSKSIEVAQ